MNDNRGKMVDITWEDTKMFSPKNKDVRISVMKTRGIFEAEYDDYLLIKSPITTNTKTGQRHPEQDPTFYLIPKRAIVNMKYGR